METSSATEHNGTSTLTLFYFILPPPPFQVMLPLFSHDPVFFLLPAAPFRSFLIPINPPTTTSGIAFVRRQSMTLFHPPTLCPLNLSLSFSASPAHSLLSSHAPSLGPIFINIVLMIPDGPTCYGGEVRVASSKGVRGRSRLCVRACARTCTTVGYMCA